MPTVETPIETMVTAFRDRCRASGLALTHQRELIYRAIVSSKHHPSPELIFDEVRRQTPSISLATVYKNIHTFLEAGLLREVSPHHGSLRLEANLAEHHHLVCTRCKAIVDLDESELEPIHLSRKLRAGYRILRYTVEFQGLCPACTDALKTT